MPGLLWAWKFSKASALVSVVRLLPVAREISALRGVSPRCTHHWVRRVDSTIFQWVSRSFWARFVSSRLSQPFLHSAELPERRGNGSKYRLFAHSIRLRTPGSPILGWKSPKVSGPSREYSRFAETIVGDWFAARACVVEAPLLSACT